MTQVVEESVGKATFVCGKLVMRLSVGGWLCEHLRTTAAPLVHHKVRTAWASLTIQHARLHIFDNFRYDQHRLFPGCVLDCLWDLTWVGPWDDHRTSGKPKEIECSFAVLTLQACEYGTMRSHAWFACLCDMPRMPSLEAPQNLPGVQASVPEET